MNAIKLISPTGTPTIGEKIEQTDLKEQQKDTSFLMMLIRMCLNSIRIDL